MIGDHEHHHIENDEAYKGLNVNSGVEQPDSFDESSIQRFLKNKRKNQLSVEEYVAGILEGNRTILSKAVTLVESSKPEHQKIAQQIILKCLPYSGKSIRIGITGVPGVGKSTFIESTGKYITSLGHKLAVLAIDPSSERSKGSILGDKTRMEELSIDPNAYIRPSPSAGSLGGVARKTRETIILCEAAGFDVIFIETVGVGQSETVVHSMVDFFLLLMLSGAGDELQGIKRGIMEMADAITINKADGDNVDRAEMARVQYMSALQLFPPTDSGWKPKVLTCSAYKKIGIDKIWKTINDYLSHVNQNGYFQFKRSEQSKFWMYETINDQLKSNFYQNPKIKEILGNFEGQVLNEELSSFVAAKELLETYYQSQKVKE
ncbi:methylmalonyl Co-A mutase-associated GTPase MeaB [Mangrovibacterium diazotrophicum]|uniref:Methylmalonyl-CoA mutase metallochaperone MeaB n=1 Tax=Mangrovibacterium diazotrophicum TaxID=1261403 RepID=A0A419VV71_9BACT|nr:methylmalonyl Co-A mutase-associated GTPase MeaB [Mangrovibacterium diazotrophicum]RKD86049.1 methylmalonyl-CoA mutase metallochaperone MeaB [Mangrovibacterium diazotrophicum]